MSTTLITNIEPNGVGVMSRELARHVPEITKVIAVRCDTNVNNDLVFPCETHVPYKTVRTEDLRRADNDKFLYVESACGADLGDRESIFIPMWEQGATAIEAQRSHSKIIAITKHTKAFLKERFGLESILLPWPVDVPKSFRLISSVRTILHNAGGLGANFRKGTPQAIRIFQKSGVAKDGVKLVIRAHSAPPIEIVDTISAAPDGIKWVSGFSESLDELYENVDLLLHPSKLDGSPLIPYEAMARGIPALVTDIPPLNECENDFLISIARYEPSPLLAPYVIVDVDAGAEKLRTICSMDLSLKSGQVRETVIRERSRETVGSIWRELCK